MDFMSRIDEIVQPSHPQADHPSPPWSSPVPLEKVWPDAFGLSVGFRVAPTLPLFCRASSRALPAAFRYLHGVLIDRPPRPIR